MFPVLVTFLPSTRCHSEGSPRRLDIQLKPGFIMGREMVVIGEQFKGQAKALNQQKTTTTLPMSLQPTRSANFPIQIQVTP